MTDAFADVTVIVLAGGKGTRIRAIHPDLPKPLIPVSGKPFLYWLTLWLSERGLNQIVYATGWMGDQIDAWCKLGDFPQLSLSCRKEDEPLGTGGALFHCLDTCRDWVLLVNGDALCMGGLTQLLRLRSHGDLDGGLIGVEMRDTSRYGSLVVGADGLLSSFREKVPGAGLINGGVYLFRKDRLTPLGRPGSFSIEREMISDLLAEGAKLRVVKPTNCPFLDIGTPESLMLAERFIEDQFGHFGR